MNKPFTFAVIGGDLRQAKLAEMLSSDGHYVLAFALEKSEMPSTVRQVSDIRDAICPADCIILPLPVTGKAGYLNTPLSAEICPLDEIFSPIRDHQLVCAGRVCDDTLKAAEKYGLRIVDYFAREELAVLNAVCTAEGAIAIAMDNTAITLCGAKILVLGFGRIGKLLSHRLRGLGADVHVSARSHSDRAWIKAYGYKPMNTLALAGKLRDFDIIINTIPAPVLDEDLLREVDKDCLLMDLASKPGGIDFSAAARLGHHAIWALSLPGEAAPVTSGEIIRDTIYNILHEEEESSWIT
ncbi:MAG: dipicolinate synthase subunit DpsA [Clostridiales bacterium]|nr:dipicolinate synthase subunit DpsA [Clostridiales bacterium]